MSDEQEWQDFLTSLEKRDSTLAYAVSVSRELLVSIKANHTCILPVTSLDDNDLQLAWRTLDGKYLEIKISQNHTCDLFFRDSRRDKTVHGSFTTSELLKQILFLEVFKSAD